MVQNAPAELLNNVELATASDLVLVTVWEEGRHEKIIFEFIWISWIEGNE